MFIGRKSELNNLEERYLSNKFELIIMYGRRRVGKTTLLTQFCQNKKAIFYAAKEENSSMALESFSTVVNEYYKNDNIEKFQNFEKLFDYIYNQSKDERLILVIDEFPYLANSNKSIMSLLQNMIDHKFESSKLFIILCGSSISFMEENVLGYKSPLYGRRTGQMKILPFTFKESCEYMNNFTNVDKVIAYGAMGGIPKYLNFINDKISIKQNIIKNFLNSASYMFEEPLVLLKQELREPSTYNSIISSIANGYTKLNEISTKIGEQTDKTAKYISALMELQIVKKEVPITEKENTKKSIYSLNDNMFKFWYRFVYNNMSEIEFVNIEYLYNNKIKPNLEDYCGKIFEDICKEFLLYLNKDLKLPIVFTKIGRWWGLNPHSQMQEEIDILAFEKNDAIFAECKWRNDKVNIKVLNDLIEKSKLLNQFNNNYYFLFSKVGFTDEVIEQAQNNAHIKLFTIDDIVNYEIDT